jgi:hypothetical protein
MAMSPTATFSGNEIAVSRYPFRPGFRKARLAIRAEEIREVDVDRCALLVGEEIIYLPGWPRAELTEFCSRNRVRTVARYDSWADILDPFVDTSFTKKEVLSRNTRLRAAGFNSGRVFGLRLLVALPIIIFQGIAGEWTGLYHYHLLYAVRALRLVGLYGWAYRATMRVAREPYEQSA